MGMLGPALKVCWHRVGPSLGCKGGDMAIPPGTTGRTSYKTLVVVITLIIIFCVLPCICCWILGAFGYVTDRVAQ
jgi:hypothetical protein